MKTLSNLALVSALCAAAAFAQTLPNAVPMPNPEVQFLNQAGQPLAGGFVYTYAAGTTTPIATYTDSTAGTPNANPIVLDSAGRAAIWIGPAAIKILVQDANSVTQFTQDNISDTTLYFANYVQTVGTDTLITDTAPGTGAVQRTVAAVLHDTIRASDYGTVCDGMTNDSAHIQAALTYSATTAGAFATVVLPAGVCVANIVMASNESIVGAGNATANPGFGMSNSFAPPASSTTLQDASSGASPVITITSGDSFVGISNLTLTGTGTGAADRGVYSANSTYVSIENVACNYFAEECILQEAGGGGNAWFLNHIFAANVVLNRSRAAHTGAVNLQGTDNFFLNSEVGVSTSIAGHSASSNCYNDAVVIGGANSFLSNVIGETSELGLYWSGTETRIVNSRFDNNYCSGVWSSGNGNFGNSLLFNNGLDGTGDWDGMEVTGYNTSFTGVTIEQTNSIALTYGVTDMTASDTNWNSYSNFRFLGGISVIPQAYNFAGGGSSVAYDAKDVVEIPDTTASPNVDLHTLFSFAQTTPITITALANGTNGQTVCFFGNDNVTFSSGGNIVPRNPAAIIPMQALRVYCYIQAQGNWYEITTSDEPSFGTTTVTGTLTEGLPTGYYAAPTVTCGAGSGCSTSASGDNLYGYAQVVVGTGGASGPMITMTFPHAPPTYSAQLKCVISPASSNSAPKMQYIYVGVGGSNWIVTINTTNESEFTPTDTYGFWYVCGQ